MRRRGPIIEVASDRVAEAVAVLADAFAGYPFIRHLIGPTGDADAAHVRRLLDYFVRARLLRQGFVLGVEADAGTLAGVALVTPPVQAPPPAALGQLRERLWAELGADARARYEAAGVVWKRFAIDAPHWHLNMIGVARAHAGKGLGRLLLEDVHGRAAEEPGSAGVSLTTEHPANVPLYQRFGYRVVGEAELAPGLVTWGMFRAGG